MIWAARLWFLLVLMGAGAALMGAAEALGGGAALWVAARAAPSERLAAGVALAVAVWAVGVLLGARRPPAQTPPSLEPEPALDPVVEISAPEVSPPAAEEDEVVTTERGVPEAELHSVERSTLSAAPSASLFDVQVPAIDDEDEADGDAADDTDGDIQLPAGATNPPAAAPSLFEALRERGTLALGGGPRGAGGETAVRPVPMGRLASAAEVVGEPHAPEDDGAEVERLYRRTFEELVATKEACHESVEGLDYARFRAKLVRTRRSLMDRFQCEDVRFRVYVKEGRAALKAAPLLSD